MARGFNSFFDGFNQGYDTTGRVLRDVEMARIARATPEEVVTPVETMQGYEGAAPDASGAMSQMDLADAPMAQQKTGFKLLGQTYNQAPSDTAIANARMRAMADVISRDDPVQGLRMRQQVMQGERDDVRFEREGKRFDQEQREAGLRTKGLERKERTESRDEDTEAAFGRDLASYTGAPEQLTDAVKYINNGSRSLTMSERDKDGLVRLSVVKPDGTASFLTLPHQDQATLFAASRMLQSNPTKALALMAGVNKDLAAAVANENGLTRYVADNTNDVASKADGMRTNRARLGLESQRLGIDRERLGIARQQLDRSNWTTEQYTDEDGNLHTYDVNRASPGKPQFVQRAMPEGLRPFTPRESGLKVNLDGSVIKDGRLYMPDPKTGRFKEAQGLGPSATDLALARLGQNGDAGQQAGGLPRPVAAAPAAPALERTVTPTGEPRFRVAGQNQWYPSESAARWAEIQRIRGAGASEPTPAEAYGLFLEQ